MRTLAGGGLKLRVALRKPLTLCGLAGRWGEEALAGLKLSVLEREALLKQLVLILRGAGSRLLLLLLLPLLPDFDLLAHNRQRAEVLLAAERVVVPVLLIFVLVRLVAGALIGVAPRGQFAFLEILHLLGLLLLLLLVAYFQHLVDFIAVLAGLRIGGVLGLLGLLEGLFPLNFAALCLRSHLHCLLLLARAFLASGLELLQALKLKWLHCVLLFGVYPLGLGVLIGVPLEIRAPLHRPAAFWAPLGGLVVAI